MAQSELEPDVVTADYVRLERRVEIQDIGALVTVELEAVTEQAVITRVIDEFPPDASVSKARFVPDFEPMEGSIDTVGAVFDTRVPADESVTVKYGLRLEDPTMAGEFTTPRIDIAQPINDVASEASINGGRTAAILAELRDAASDESAESGINVKAGAHPSETSPEPEEVAEEPPEEEEAEEPPEEEEAEEPPEEEAPEEPDAEPEAADVGGPDPAPAGSMLDELIAELQDPDIGDEHLAELRDGLGLDSPRSMDIRLTHVQSRMEEWAAYVETLQMFIDDHGRPTEFADEVLQEHESLRDELAQARAEITDAADARAALEEQLAGAADARAALEEQLADAAEERAAFEEELADAADARAALEEQLADAAEERAAFEEQLAEAADERTALEEELADAAEERGGLQDQLADAAEERTALKTQLADAADHRAALHDQLADATEERAALEKELADALEEIASLRTQLEAVEEDLKETTRSLREDVEANTEASEQFSSFVENLQTLSSNPSPPDAEDEDQDESS